MASSVVFLDDTQTTLGASNSDLDIPSPSCSQDTNKLKGGQMLDEFLISRMNDSTR
jgi:hypothetical protein